MVHDSVTAIKSGDKILASVLSSSTFMFIDWAFKNKIVRLDLSRPTRDDSLVDLVALSGVELPLEP